MREKEGGEERRGEREERGERREEERGERREERGGGKEFVFGFSNFYGEPLCERDTDDVLSGMNGMDEFMDGLTQRSKMGCLHFCIYWLKT